MNKNKIGSVFFVSILALAGVGVSFAGLSDIITVYGSVSTATVEFEISYSGTDVWKVYGPGAPEDEVVIWTGFSDDPLRPTKASLETQYPGCTALLVASSWAMPGTTGFDVDVVYENIFPCVPFKANIAAHYIGSIPAHVTISNLVWNSGEEFFGSHLVFYSYLVYGNSVNFPLQMHYCDTLTIEVTITLPQLNGLQGKSGSFSFDIEAIQWTDPCDDQFPGKTINLPSTFVWGSYAHPGPSGLYSSYWDITLSGVPEGDYNVENALYDGWCVSQYIYINPPGPYRLRLWSSLDYDSDPDFPWPGNHWPTYAWDWPCVNWILNHRSNYPTATYTNFQDAFWYFVDGGSMPGGIAGTIANDAMANVEAWYANYPQSGDRVAVLCEVVDANGNPLEIQHCFIDVDP